MAQRADFGASWQDVVAEWCLGSPLPMSPDAAWLALSTLERLWPEYLDEVLAKGDRGPSVMAAVIERGKVLTACEGLQGFAPVLGRIKNPATMQATWPEVIVAATLVKLGYTPEFEPTVEGRNPDMGLVINGKDVYIEVIAPEESDEYKQALQAAQDLAMNLCKAMNATRLEVLLEQVGDHQAALEGFMRNTPPSNQVVHLAGVGLIRYSLLDSGVPNAGPTIESDAGYPITGVARFRVQGNVPQALTVVRFPFDDDRVQRLITRELRHFSRSTRNLLVISVSGSPGASFQSWMPVVQRRFQPCRNQRLGAVALFHQGINSATAAIRQRWLLLRNDYALLPAPQRLLDDLAGLDQPW